GPVGAGKSTVARALAHALGLEYINTGAMYRAFAVAAREGGFSPDDPQVEGKLEPLLKSTAVTFSGDNVMLNGRDVTRELSDPGVSELASRFSTLGAVRERMRELQRAAGGKGGVVMEGRDIGTAIFPDAEVKFFLEASVEERARRRCAELQAKGIPTGLAEVLAQLAQRDHRDRSRELAPLRRAADAIAIDSTDMTVNEVVATMQAHIERRCIQKGLKQT
ncbi:MAG: (d)CMP kinase, partial [Candidatus Binataceae bacterium]